MLFPLSFWILKEARRKWNHVLHPPMHVWHIWFLLTSTLTGKEITHSDWIGQARHFFQNGQPYSPQNSHHYLHHLGSNTKAGSWPPSMSHNARQQFATVSDRVFWPYLEVPGIRWFACKQCAPKVNSCDWYDICQDINSYLTGNHSFLLYEQPAMCRE